MDVAQLKTEDDIMDALLSKNTSISTILNTRLSHIQLLRQSWDDEGGTNIKGVIALLVLSIRDNAVLNDILKILNIRPRLYTLETCAALLDPLNELLFEIYEEYVLNVFIC
jgi:katanin p80 WD40 repeat-containing subunit B1